MSHQLNSLVNKPINVIVDKITLPPTDEIDFYLSIIGAVVAVLIPIGLFIASIYFSKQSTKRAKEYADGLRLSDKKILLSDNTYRTLDNLDKAIKNFYHHNYMVKIEVTDSKKYNNDLKIIKEKLFEIDHGEPSEKLKRNEVALIENQRHCSTKIQLNEDKIQILTEKIGATSIEMQISIRALTRLLDDQLTLSINKLVSEIIKSSYGEIGISTELMDEFNNEIDNISNYVEKNIGELVKEIQGGE